jgi:hypothetical protein
MELKKSDDTPTGVRIQRIGSRKTWGDLFAKVKGRMVFVVNGAERIPQKSIKFEIIDLDYYQNTADPDNYQVTLWKWTDGVND